MQNIDYDKETPIFHEHMLDRYGHPAFYRKPLNKFTFFYLCGLASNKKTEELGIGELLVTYAILAKLTGFKQHQVRHAVNSLIKNGMLVKLDSKKRLHLCVPHLKDLYSEGNLHA